jgi:hypothetical protein
MKEFDKTVSFLLKESEKYKRYLYHGTSFKKAKKILKEGFSSKLNESNTHIEYPLLFNSFYKLLDDRNKKIIEKTEKKSKKLIELFNKQYPKHCIIYMFDDLDSAYRWGEVVLKVKIDDNIKILSKDFHAVLGINKYSDTIPKENFELIQV